MADAQKVIDLIFNGVDRTGAATQAALKNAQSFTDSLQKGTQPIADFTVGALKLEAALLTVGAAVTLFAVKVAGDFDTAFREISTLIDQPVDDLGEFSQAIRDYAATSSKPLEEVTQSIYNAISAGVNYADSIGAVAQAEKLSIAGKAGLNDSLVVLVSSLNAYGVGMDKAEQFSDLLFQTVRSGQTTLPELSASLAQVTGLAATAGVGFDELLAGIATLTATGTPTSQAITQIRGAISSILKPTAEAEKVAAGLGIQFNLARLESVGFAGILDDVQKATGGNAEQMAKLFGSVEGLNAALTLTGLGASKFEQTLTDMANASGATEAAFEKMSTSFELSNQKVANAVSGVLISIGTPLLNEYGGIANAIAAIFNGIGASVSQGELGNLVAFVESIFADVQRSLETVAKNLPAALDSADFSSFEKAITVVLDAVRTLFSNIDLTSVDGLKNAIELAGAAFLGLSQYTAGVIESFKPLFDLLVRVGQGAATVDSDIFKLAGSLGGFVTQLNFALPAVNTLLGLLIVKEAGGLAAAAAKAATSVGTLGIALGQAGLVGAAGAAGYAVGTALVDPINKFVSSLTGSQTSLGSWIYDLVNGSKEAELFGNNVGASAAGVDKLGSAVGGIGFDALSNEANKTVSALGAMETGLDGVAGAVDKVVEGVTTHYLDASGNVIKSTIESREALEEWNQALLTLGGVQAEAGANMRTLGDGSKYTVEQLKALREESGLGVPVYDASTGAFLRYEQTIKSAANSTDKTAEAIKKTAAEMKKAEEATRAWDLEMKKLEGAERIALIQAQTTIATTRIEADAQKMVAAFDSVSASVTSTGETLTSLFGTLGSGNLDRLQELKLENEIQKESIRRDEALKLQQDLTRAQIKEMQARTEAVARGDSLIKIDGAGLQPHLEAFMWEILKAIQVRVNADGLEMLLDSGVT